VGIEGIRFCFQSKNFKSHRSKNNDGDGLWDNGGHDILLVSLSNPSGCAYSASQPPAVLAVDCSKKNRALDDCSVRTVSFDVKLNEDLVYKAQLPCKTASRRTPSDRTMPNLAETQVNNGATDD
jgi:hypothetical protein